jgi:hypothetical protein
MQYVAIIEGDDATGYGAHSVRPPPISQSSVLSPQPYFHSSSQPLIVTSARWVRIPFSWRM